MAYMKRSITSVLIVLACLVVSSATQACVLISPEAQSWEHRQSLVSYNLPLEIEATLEYHGASRRLYLMKNAVGTVVCLDSWSKCAPLSSLDSSLNTLPDVSLLYGLLTATTPDLVFGPAQPLPGAQRAWALPTGAQHDLWPAKFKDWSFNLEVGYPLPGKVVVPAHDRREALTLTLERFAAGSSRKSCCR